MTLSMDFEKKISTNTAAYDLVNYIYKGLDLNYYTLALFFDLSRAFDCVDPSYLVKKLYALGIRGNINQWISSFLTDRFIRVKVKTVFLRKKT